MEYSALFSRGWSIIWRNKWMWLLAFIPAMAGLITFGFNAVLQLSLIHISEPTRPY